MMLERRKRIHADLAELTAWAAKHATFAWAPAPAGVVFRYRRTVGLLQTPGGIRAWADWQATVLLPPGYPVEAPVVWLRPVGSGGAAFHPNVSAQRPQLLCYGRHVPVLGLAELARRAEQIVSLRPESMMTDERDALNPAACRFVRWLMREGGLPIRADAFWPTPRRVGGRA